MADNTTITMSEEDQALEQAYKEAWEAAKAAGDQAAMDQAHAGAEKLRATYGYGGGADGSQQIALSDYYNKYGTAYDPTKGTAVDMYSGGSTAITQGYAFDGKTYDANGNLIPIGSIVMGPDGTDYIVTYEGGMKYSDYVDRLRANTITPVTGISSTGANMQQGAQDPGFNWALAEQTGLHAAGQPGFGSGNNKYLTTDANGNAVWKELTPQQAAYVENYRNYVLDNSTGNSTGTTTQLGSYSGTIPGITGTYNPTATTNTTASSGGSYTYGGSVDETAAGYIRDIYAAQTKAATDALKAAYDQNVLAGNAARDAIPGTYYEARNSTAGTAAMNRRNFNEYAAASGLNSGAGSQARLAMDNTLLSNLSSINTQQAKDISAVDLQLAQLTAKYQNDIAAAVAEGEFEKAKALYNQYLTDQEAARQQAQFDAQMALSKDQLAAANDDTNYSRSLTYAQTTGDYSSMASWWTHQAIANAVGIYAQTLRQRGSTAEEVAYYLSICVDGGSISLDESAAILKNLVLIYGG